jgi:hypothetical protein
MCDPPEGISAGPLNDADFFKWEAGKRERARLCVCLCVIVRLIFSFC